jgi:hypothetical protein
MARAERTLVKSAPELWELLDDPDLMRRWTAELLEAPQAVPVVVTEREEGERLAWRVAGGRADRDASVELALAEKGFGTNVSIQAERAEGRSDDAEDVLERLLDELGSPQRKPFTRA